MIDITSQIVLYSEESSVISVSYALRKSVNTIANKKRERERERIIVLKIN